MSLPGLVTFIIPIDSDVRTIWLQRIGNLQLQDSEDSIFLHNHPVCKTHFANICLDDAGHLKKYSLPTLNLPDYNNPSMEENCFYRAKTTAHPYVTPEKLRGILKKLPATDATADPSTSKEGDGPPLKVQQFKKVYARSRKNIFPSVSHSDVPGSSLSTDVSSLPATTEKSSDLDQQLSQVASDLDVRDVPTTPSPPELHPGRGEKRKEAASQDERTTTTKTKMARRNS